MTPDQITAAKTRAQEVVNGFKAPRVQQARDAVRLAETLQLRNRQIARLREEMRYSSPNNIPDFLKGIFGERGA